MKGLATLCFWLGLLSIPIALVVFFGYQRELGIFVGHWPPTLLILGYILEQKAA